MKQRVYELLEPARPGDVASRVVDVLLVSLILFSVFSLVLESDHRLYASASWFFDWSERVVLLVFGLEYLLRIWACTCQPSGSGWLSGRLRHAARPAMLVDLVAVLPGLLPFIGLDMRFVRIFRVFRLFRVLKLGRYTRAFSLIARVLMKTRGELVVSLTFVLALLLVASCLMHYAEGGVQPDHFGSIPDAMWWAIVTLTTVGYGDVYPVTWAGRLVAGVMAVLAIGLVGLPTGILGAGFVAELQGQSSERGG